MGAEGEPPSPEALQKFHMWRANTSSLVVAALQIRERVHLSYDRQISDRYVRETLQVLACLSAEEPQVIEARFSDVLGTSIDLDREFSLQVANLYWKSLGSPSSSRRFNAAFMELDRGQRYTDSPSMVRLVLAPALLKLGKSSGDDFDSTTCLLKMEVTTERPPEQQPNAWSRYTGPHRG